MTLQNTGQEVTNNAPPPIRLAILQRVCTGYRLGLFMKLAALPGFQVRLFLGDDVPATKVRSTADLRGIDHVKCPTRFIPVRGHAMPWHRGLRKELDHFDPDVILCEGESNLLNYLQAIWYRRSHRSTKLIHWSLGGLPGVPVRPSGTTGRIKRLLQRPFDGFLVYSSYGKECLVALGHDASKISIATNVADTHAHMASAASLSLSPAEAREQLGLPNRFTVLYAGAMDANKRPDALLDVARESGPDDYNMVLLGAGGMLDSLRERVAAENLENVYLPGRVSEALPLYFRASDAMLMPGRGGMVISEAMAWSLPVVVHQADGTEFDLVVDGETGIRLQDGSVSAIRAGLDRLRNMADRGKSLGEAGFARLNERFLMEHMVSQIEHCVLNVVSSNESPTP